MILKIMIAQRNRTLSVLLTLMMISLVCTGCPRKNVIPSGYKWGDGPDNYRTRAAVCKLEELAAGIRVYNRLFGSVPPVSSNLIQTLETKGVSFCAGGKTRGTMNDPWQERVVYSISNSIAVLKSSGPDKTQGTSDDIELCVSMQNGTNLIWDSSERRIWNYTLETRRKRGMK